MSEEKKQLTYADAGVDIDAGNKAVELMKDSVRATYRPEVIGDLGGFGGLFALNIAKYKEPIPFSRSFTALSKSTLMSSLSITAPVGFEGELMINPLVFSSIFS